MKKFIRLLYVLNMVCFNACVAQQVDQPAYPATIGYLSFVNPVVTLDKNGAVFNYENGYTIGFPTGINILKSDRIGFSFEVTPFIRFSDTTGKVTNVLFHPGIMFRYPKGFTLLTRLAFETGGRYGCTLVFNKIVYRTKMNKYFIAVPLPVRFGNDKPASIGMAFQLGIIF